MFVDPWNVKCYFLPEIKWFAHLTDGERKGMRGLAQNQVLRRNQKVKKTKVLYEEDLITRLARIFNVSPQARQYRLSNLGILTSH